MGHYLKLIAVLLCTLLISLPGFGIDQSRELENQRIDFIKSSLDEKGIAYEERSLFTSQGGFGRSIHIEYLFSDTEHENNREQFVLAVPISTLHDTENTERFDILAALHLAEQLKNNAPPLNVRIAFLGDEYSSLPNDIPSKRNISLDDLFSLYDTPENIVICYIDLPFAPNKLSIHHGSDGTVAPLSIIEPLTDIFEHKSVPYYIYVKYNELYKLQLIQSQAPLRKIQAADFPGLLIKGDEDTFHSVSPELCGELFASYISNIDISSENHDTHYFFISAFNKTFYFSETFTVLTFLIIGLFSLVLFLIYSLTHRHILLAQWGVFIKRSWIILLHFLILTGSIFVSGLIYLFIQRILDVPNLRHTNYISILIRIFIALCFYNLCVPISYRFWIPRKDRFYGNAAVALVVLGTIIAVFLDITFVPIFLWSFIFTLLGTIFINPWIVLLCTILVPLQISGAIINIVYSGSPALALLISSNNAFITLFIACIMLPEILMANRIILLFRHGRSDKDLKTRTIQQLSIIGVTIILLVGLGIFVTFQAPLSPFREAITELPDSPKQVLTADMTSIEYLDRRVIALSIEALGNPAKFNISINNIHQNTPLVIYDAPIPFERLNEDNTVQFHLGERPDNPFNMEIVLPAELQCTILIEALYTTWDINLNPEKPENTEDYVASYSLLLSVPETEF